MHASRYYKALHQGLIGLGLVMLLCAHPLPAQAELVLPAPGTMVEVSRAHIPLTMKGLTLDPKNPLLFDFILDTGNSGLDASSPQLKEQSDSLIKYFFAGLTLPENELWVNLSPYEKNHMIPASLGATAMGRDMLAQDYLLKQITASLIYPEHELGKKFWQDIYAKSQKQFGTTQIPVNTFNKVWIMPDIAEVYVHGNTMYVAKAQLKVMLDRDYNALAKNQLTPTGPVPAPTPLTSVSGAAINNETLRPYQSSELGKLAPPVDRAPASGPPVDNTLQTETVIRNLVIPALEKEVNEGENFGQLRQIYNALILAAWFKKNLKQNIVTKAYADKSKTSGIEMGDTSINEEIYQQYLAAYKKGVFNYIKEDIDAITKKPMPRKYFSGGIQWHLKPVQASRVDLGSPGRRVKVRVEADPAMKSGSGFQAKLNSALDQLERLMVDPQLLLGSIKKIIIATRKTAAFNHRIPKIVEARQLFARLPPEEQEGLKQAFNQILEESAEIAKQRLFQTYHQDVIEKWTRDSTGSRNSIMIVLGALFFILDIPDARGEAIASLKTIFKTIAALPSGPNNQNRVTFWYPPGQGNSPNAVNDFNAFLTSEKFDDEFRADIRLLQEEFDKFVSLLPENKAMTVEPIHNVQNTSFDTLMQSLGYFLKGQRHNPKQWLDQQEIPLDEELKKLIKKYRLLSNEQLAQELKGFIEGMDMLQHKKYFNYKETFTVLRGGNAQIFLDAFAEEMTKYFVFYMQALERVYQPALEGQYKGVKRGADEYGGGKADRRRNNDIMFARQYVALIKTVCDRWTDTDAPIVIEQEKAAVVYTQKFTINPSDQKPLVITTAGLMKDNVAEFQRRILEALSGLPMKHAFTSAVREGIKQRVNSPFTKEMFDLKQGVEFEFNDGTQIQMSLRSGGIFIFATKATTDPHELKEIADRIYKGLGFSGEVNAGKLDVVSDAAMAAEYKVLRRALFATTASFIAGGLLLYHDLHKPKEKQFKYPDQWQFRHMPPSVNPLRPHGMPTNGIYTNGISTNGGVDFDMSSVLSQANANTAVPLDLTQVNADLQSSDFTGLDPVILKITPLTDLPQILGLAS